jgi:hypothetical protein
MQPAIAASTTRTVSVGYETPNTIVLDLNPTAETRLSTVTSKDVMTEAGEGVVSVEIVDESGEAVAGRVHQGRADLGIVCGDGSEELKLVNRKPVHVHLTFGPSEGCAGVSVPTSGNITFTFK